VAETLELARGCDRVLVAGPACSFTAAALALDDARRRVLAFRESGWNATDPYVSLLPGTTRSRVELVGGTVESLPARAPSRVCMLLLERERVADLAALLQLVDVVRAGGRVVLRESDDPRQQWVRQALPELGLESSGDDGAGAILVWRKPAERSLERVQIPKRRWRRRLIVALALMALAAGIAAGVVALAGGTDDGSGASGEPAAGGSGGAPGTVEPSEIAPPTGTGGSGRNRSGRSTTGASDGSSGARAPGGPDRAGGSRQEKRSGGNAGGAGRRSGDGGARQSFSGQGAVQLGTLVVRSPSVLIWTSTAGGLRIASDALVLSSPASRGRTPLSPGSYAHFTVKSAGVWTIRIRPR
jgi:hypothetical protein